MFTIRDATISDVPEILAMIRELAEYERLSHEVSASRESLSENLFGPKRVAEAMLAEWDGRAAGYAIYFYNFSTFLGQPGLFVEDIFVRPAFRRRGIAREFFRRLAQRAIERKCGRMEFSVLDWNKPALDFYRSVGAAPLTDWTIHRFVGESLLRLAE
ncbi:MAG: GNAT family N-acetyltransferase [Phycisphaerae bacterium]|nr:GNAT family N-acetyltransferase [Phycisphaerae bacterium]